MFEGVQLEYHFSNEHNVIERRTLKSDKVISKLSLDITTSKSMSAEATFDYEYLRLKKDTIREKKGRKIRVVDLFSGCGGLSLGIKEACNALGLSFEPVLAIDNDVNCVSVYNNNFGNVAQQSDIEDIINGKIGDSATKPEIELSNSIGNIDILLAGPPCQGNSDLNNHTRRTDSRNNLYLRVARAAEIMKPTSIIIENVPAVIHGSEKAFQKTIEILSKLGYNTDNDTIDMVDIGIPQKRKRHFVIASSLTSLDVSEIMERYKIQKPRGAWWAISDLEKEKDNSIFTKATNHTPLNIQRMKFLLENNLYDLPDKYRPPCHQDGKHSYKSMYGRLRKNQPVQTITSGFTSPGQGRFMHPTQARTITPHEAARLQFFPDFFDFSGAKTRSSLASMIGNAVPMKMGLILALQILSRYDGYQ